MPVFFEAVFDEVFAVDAGFFTVVDFALAVGFAATVLAVVRDFADRLDVDAARLDDGFPTTSDWPGKMTARLSPFARISAAVVMWYFFAIPLRVS